MMGILFLTLLIFVVAVISGMLGIGVAFAAIPILGINSQDLVHEVQPIALFLNGITALFAAVAFARAGYVDWPRSMGLAAVCTVFAPIGSWAAQYTDERSLRSAGRRIPGEPPCARENIGSAFYCYHSCSCGVQSGDTLLT